MSDGPRNRGGDASVREGNEFSFPDGTRWTVEVSPGGDPDAEVVFRVLLPPGGLTPPRHRHPRATESFEVLEGALSLEIDGGWRTLAAGERVEVEPGTSHTLRNRTEEPVTIRNGHSPSDGFDSFVVRVEKLTRERGIKRATDPRFPILMSMLTLERPEVLVPGRTVDILVTHILDRLGRILRMSTGVADE